MKRTLLLLLAVPFWLNALAQDRGTVQGQINTSDGEPAPYVSVALKGTTYGASTDKSGKYELKAPAGDYTIAVSSVGLENVEDQVTIKAGETTTFKTITLRESTQQLKDVVVQANRDTYNAELPSPTLRMKTPMIEAPQNIQVVGKMAIQDQQIVDMLEGVTRNVSGAQLIEHWGNFARINMRGFRLPALRNGVNIETSWGPLTEDMSMVERIEFVKGPAGFMLAAGEPGGFYNVVTKKPIKNQENRIDLMAGSFNTIRSAIDVGGKVTDDGKLLYRLNLMGMLKGSHRDYDFNNRYTIAPSIKYEFNDRTTLTAEYALQYSQLSVMGAAYVFSNDLGDLPRDFTIAEPNIEPTEISENSAFLNLNHKLDDNWEITTQLGFLAYDQQGSSLWYADLQPNGDLIRTISSFDAYSETRSAQVYVNGDVQTGSVRHRVLVGLDASDKSYIADWNQGGVLGASSTFNIYNPTYGIPSSDIPEIDRSESLRSRAGGNILTSKVTAIYLQDELGFFDNKLRLTLAGRYTSFNGSAYGSSSEADEFTPRVGLSYSVTDNISIYGLFDHSFLPQTGQDRQGNAFDPVDAKDLEFGVKRSWAGGKWNSSLTAYQITKTNVLTADPEDINFSIQLGEVQSQGVEFDVQGEIVTGLNLILNYANTNVEITEDTNEEVIGNRVAGHAKHMTNGWLKYEFQNTTLAGVGISLGYQYQIDRSSWNWGADNDALLPDYFRLDGAVSWKTGNFDIALNINNILDEYLYSGAAYGSAYYWQSEPGTNFRLNVGYKF